MTRTIITPVLVFLAFWLALPLSAMCQFTAPASRSTKPKAPLFLDSLLSHNDSALIALCEDSLASCPTDTTYWRYLALANLALRRTADAEWCAYKRMLICKENHEGIRFYAKILYDCGDYASSAAQYEQLEEDLSANAKIACEYADALIEEGANKKAQAHLGKALLQAGSDAGLVERMANVLANLDEYDKAIVLLNNLKDDSSGRHTANMYKGFVFSRAQLYDSALKYFDRAIIEDSNNWWLKQQLIRVLSMQNDTVRMRLSLASAKRIDSTDQTFIYSEAWLALLCKDTSRCEAIYHQMLLTNPKDKTVLERLSGIMAKKKNYSEYERLSRLILNLYPDDADAYDRLGDALEISGKAQEALEVIRQGLKIDPLNLILYKSMAEAYDSLGDPLTGRGYLLAALQLYPSEPRTHQQLAEIEFELGDNQSALAELSFLRESGYQSSYTDPLERKMKAPRIRVKRR